MSKQTEFIKVISKLARHEYLTRDKWVLPSVCIAQACLESGFNLEASTLFGIKGNGVATPTQEYINGQWITINDTFEYYPDLASSVAGYYDFLANTPRYAKVINEPDYRKAVDGLINTTDGLAYATAPNYIDVVISIIEQYDLTKYDGRTGTEGIHSEPQQGKDEISVTYAKESPHCFSTSVYGEYKCIADILNVRHGAGTDKKIMISIFENTPVLCSGFYTDIGNQRWMLIQFYGLDGNVYCGFAASEYLERTN